MRSYGGQDLLEADVTRQVKDFMLWRGWRPLRHNVTKLPGGSGWVQFGEPGICDYSFIKYLRTEFAGLCVVCWVEMKRVKGGKLSDDQKKWRDRETARGAVVIKANNIAEFERSYYEVFGWVHSEEWVGGQAEMQLQEASK